MPAVQKKSPATAAALKNSRPACIHLEDKNKELAISVVSHFLIAEGIFKNTKSSHIRVNLGNDLRHTCIQPDPHCRQFPSAVSITPAGRTATGPCVNLEPLNSKDFSAFAKAF
jgi:hypothetical protein